MSSSVSGVRPSEPAPTVAVLMGGTSSERDVSLTSGRAVLEALSAAPSIGRVAAVEWGAGDRFAFDGGEPIGVGAAIEALSRFDVCFLALHGGRGEDGTVQGWLELAGVPYTGSGVAASAIALDKHAARGAVRSLGLRVAEGALVQRGDDLERTLGPLRALGANCYFVKDRWGGSSIGTCRIDGSEGLFDGVVEALDASTDVVVEAGVDGIEVSCTVATFDGVHRAWPLVEIVPRGESFFDYEQKYDADGAAENCPPEQVGREDQELVQELAIRAARSLGCTGLCRVDFLVPEAGEPVFLEVNTLPGMTPRSLVRRSAEQVGLDYTELCVRLVHDAQRRGA